MKPCLTFVLGGGGARGAFQVGALRALHEAGLRPDLLVGTSIGAVNAAAIALWGFDETGLFALELAYQKIAAADILDLNLSRLAMRRSPAASHSTAANARPISSLPPASPPT